MIREREEAAQALAKKKRGPDLSQPFGEGKSRLIRLLTRELSYRALLSVNLYRPQPEQLKFHQSQAKERLALGGNRGMKTTCSAAELAWALMGCHPYRYYPKENGRAICVAKDGTQLGQIMYRKLFKAGSFRICLDKKTGLFRAWTGHQDEVPYRDTKFAPPLIPDRYIADIAWENKAENIPRLVTLTNGWEILFCSSLGKPPHGMDVDVVWFDEEVRDGDWYPEMAARLVDRGGCFFWSATPQLATDRLWNLHERAEEAASDGDVESIQEFHFLIENNPFITDADKQGLIRKYADDPDEFRVRVLGQFKITSQRVYPDFRKDVHCIPSFEITKDWCRYLIIDPGFANFCALIVAVPPKNDPRYGHVYVADELYVHQLPVSEQANRIKDKWGNLRIEAFLIDAHGSRRTEGIGLNLADQLEQEFRRVQFSSIATHFSFYQIGANTEQIGTKILGKQVSQVRSWLVRLEELNDKPILQIFEDRCPKLIGEMEKYKNKVVDGQATDEPDSRKYSHGPDCVRYAVLYGVPYVKPRAFVKGKALIYSFDEVYQARKSSRAKKKDHVLLGSS